ncbi:hypothetical protein ACFFGH_08890 [Lysobacter korlensis]|uniref:PAS domain-containing protein n=1 Tax=Lysobacter korlensis TaxID=553636 RepID=A0ABV6RLU5_9GAMM
MSALVPGARSVLAWLVLLAASVAGLLAPLDGWLFDLLVRVGPLKDPAAGVALVRYPGDWATGRPAALTALVDQLENAGAAEVLVIRPAGSAPARGALTLDAGDVCRPPAAQGVIRALPFERAGGGPCLIGTLARRLGVEPPAARTVSPDFTVRTATAVPRVDAHPWPSPALLQQAAGRRVALVFPEPALPVYLTPLYDADGLLEPSTLHALTLDALIKGDAIRWAPRGADVALALLVLLTLRFGLRQARFRTLLWASLAATVPLLLLSFVLLRWAGLYLAPTAGLIALAYFALHTLVRRNRALSETLVELDHRLTGLVQQPLRRTFDQPAELTWEHVNHFVSQFFELQRSLMLQLPAGLVHLRPVSAIGCSVEDIVELRRDYRRAPFSTALAREKPTPPERPFLQPVEGLFDFVAPLVAADQLVGFWAFSVRPRSDAEIETLVPEAARYAEELAKVVLRSNSIEPTDGEVSQRSPSLAQMRSRLLDGAMRAREQIAAYRDVFAAVGHPIAVTDLLGRIQLANPAFEQLAATVSQPLLAMSVHNMLEQLCGLSPTAAKDTLRRVMLRGELDEAGLPVRSLETSVDYALYLHPIRRQTRGAGALQGSPFELLGLIVEISPNALDANGGARVGQAASQYTRRTWSLLDHLLRGMERLPAAAAERDVMIDHIVRGLDDSRQMLRALDAATAGGDHDVQIDLPQLLQRVRHGLMHHAAEKKVEIRVGEAGPRTVYGRPDELRAVLADALDLLLDDAAPDSAIDVGVAASKDGRSAVILLTNEGFGLPQWHVNEAMRTSANVAAGHVAASPLERLAHSAQFLDAAVVLDVQSELGRGYSVRLTVPVGPHAAT